MKKFLLSMIFMVSLVSASAKPYLIQSITKESNGTREVTSFTYEQMLDVDGSVIPEGHLLTVNDEYSKFTFDYAKLSSNILTMTRVDSDSETTLYEMTLNEEGNVVKVLEYNNGVLDEDYCIFEYTDGYLSNYKQVSSEEVEESIITYTEYGKISKVENFESGNLKETLLYEYDKGVEYTQIGYLWDMFYGVDLDDMEWVAVAGFLGKRINGIPSSITTSVDNMSEKKSLDWVCDIYGFPIEISVTENNETKSFEIAWHSGSTIDVNLIKNDNNSPARFYNINGVEVSGDTKGIVIERKSDGSVVKHLNP